MTSLEFNKKWQKYKEEGFYGLAVDIPEIVEYLDKEFEELSKIEGFSFSQIKFKFNHPRVYISPSSLQEKAFEIERIMAKLYKEYESKKGI